MEFQIEKNPIALGRQRPDEVGASGQIQLQAHFDAAQLGHRLQPGARLPGIRRVERQNDWIEYRRHFRIALAARFAQTPMRRPNFLNEGIGLIRRQGIFQRKQQIIEHFVQNPLQLLPLEHIA